MSVNIIFTNHYMLVVKYIYINHDKICCHMKF